MTDIEKKEENKIFGCEIPNELIIAGVGIGVAIIAYGIYYFYNQYGIPGEGDVLPNAVPPSPDEPSQGEPLTVEPVTGADDGSKAVSPDA